MSVFFCCVPLECHQDSYSLGPEPEPNKEEVRNSSTCQSCHCLPSSCLYLSSGTSTLTIQLNDERFVHTENTSSRDDHNGRSDNWRHIIEDLQETLRRTSLSRFLISSPFSSLSCWYRYRWSGSGLIGESRRGRRSARLTCG